MHYATIIICLSAISTPKNGLQVPVIIKIWVIYGMAIATTDLQSIIYKDKDENHKYFYDLSFGKRTEYKLFDMEKYPWQMNNLAKAKVFKELKKQLNKELKTIDDPRVKGNGKIRDQYPYTVWGQQYNEYNNYLKTIK